MRNFEVDRLKYYFLKHIPVIFYLHLWKNKCFHTGSFILAFYTACLSSSQCTKQEQYHHFIVFTVLSVCTDPVFPAGQGQPQCLTIILYLPHCSYYKNNTLPLKENNNNACSEGCYWLIDGLWTWLAITADGVLMPNEV